MKKKFKKVVEWDSFDGNLLLAGAVCYIGVWFCKSLWVNSFFSKDSLVGCLYIGITIFLVYLMGNILTKRNVYWEEVK